ncbi:uncharacterized protein [Aristolochia californica]|uniref:uncharacterized protein n=1 Tax=Aristolochia californica TaxID=171875 RepID=UPI0035E22C03
MNKSASISSLDNATENFRLSFSPFLFGAKVLRNSNKGNVKCWNCGKCSHIKKNYKALKKDEKKNDVANVATEEVQDVLLFSVDSPIDFWVLVSELLFTPPYIVRSWRIMLLKITGKVYLTDGEPLDIVGIGNVKFRMSNGSVWKIHKVRLVPKLMRTLISVGKLDDEGHNVIFNVVA